MSAFTFVCPPMNSLDVWEYSLRPAQDSSESDSGVASGDVTSESSRASSPVSVNSEEDFMDEILKSCVNMAMESPKKGENKVQPSPIFSQNPLYSRPPPSFPYQPVNFTNIPPPNVKTVIPLLNGGFFPMAPNEPVWPNFTLRPNKREDAALRERIRCGQLKLKRLYRNYKTTMCNSFEKDGTCPRGEKCAFAHGENELRSPRILNPFVHKTRPCTRFAKGFCKYGEKCTFMHLKRQ
ncbi:unnamed protein product [Bursaphelenchus xylophilus]|nr:unnamed protein product [Bursaphelenchus xylophilus]CAG9104780.1 unnamed protein product [Bursaphelenchus xylophilus]